MSQKKEQKTHDSYDLRAVLEEIELDLIRNLRRNIKHHEKEEEKEGFRWEMWQKAKLRNLAKYRKQNKEIVGRRSKEIEDLINKTLQESFDTAESMMQKLFRKIKTFFTRRGMQYPEDISHRGLNKPVLSEEDFFDVNEKKIDALQNTAEPSRETAKQPEEKPQPDGTYVPEGREKDLTGRDNDQKLDDLKKQVGKDMKEVQGAIWRRMDDIYRQTIYKAEMFMAAGAKTLDQAIDLATREFLAGGIDCIEYSNGRRVNVASYAEMALRTASQRATFLAEGKKRDEWGIHTIFVSAHANTCPKCEPWQGKILVDDVFSSGTAAEAAELGVPLLSTAMKAGLLHPNCRHTLATYFPDITILPKVPDKDKALKTYEAEQKQRALERKIRKAKRKVAGACDNDNIRKAQTELRDLQRQIREHLDRHPELRRAYEREKLRDLPTGIFQNESGMAEEQSNKSEIIKNLKKRIGKISDHEPVGLFDIKSKYRDDLVTTVKRAPTVIQNFLKNHRNEILIINESAGVNVKESEQGISINLKEDYRNESGKWCDTFHEIGHRVDRISGRPSQNPIFEKNLKNDFENLVRGYQKLYNVNRSVAYREISEAISGAEYHSVSDLLGAMSNNECVGEYAHWDLTYWKKPGRLGREAFAHFFEAAARNDTEKIEILKQTFPDSYKMFEKMLEELE